MRRRFSVLFAVLLMSAVAMPIPALADNNCDVGEFCIWGDPDYGGDFWDPSTNDPQWDWFNVENDDDALWNRELNRATVYNADYYGGTALYCAVPGLEENDIAGARDDQGDSSINWSTGYTTCTGFYLP